MQLTLKQARRVEREIGAELERQTTNNRHSGHSVSIYEDLRSKVQSAQETLLTDLTKVQNLARIRFVIRKEIETMNEVSGLNKLMNREAELKYVLQVLQQLTAAELTDSELEIAVQRHAAVKTATENGTPTQNRYGQPADEVSLNTIVRTDTMGFLRDSAKNIQRELVKLVEGQAGINLNTKVVLEDEDAKLLEEAGIVL